MYYSKDGIYFILWTLGDLTCKYRFISCNTGTSVMKDVDNEVMHVWDRMCVGNCCTFSSILLRIFHSKEKAKSPF